MAHDELPALNADQLAQYRGCWPDNECYHDCVEAARATLDEPDTERAREEIRKAAVWAAQETWI